MRLPFGRFRQASAHPAAGPLHDSLVAQVRNPLFYTAFGVPDTFEGRFDLLVLHAGLVLRRLGDVAPAAEDLAQSLVDTMFARFDVAMRELGVSDIGVPKRMGRLAEAFKGRTAAYHGALGRSDHPALVAAIARNIIGEGGDAEGLARYTEASVAALGAAPLETLGAGRFAFPDPASFCEASA